MASVKQFAQYLLLLEPQKSAPLLSLYNYLKNHCDLDDKADPQVFSSFIRHSLNFEFWRKNHKALLSNLEDSVSSFSQQYNLSFTPKMLDDFSKKQVIHISDIDNLTSTLSAYFKDHLPEDDQKFVRLLQIADNKIMLIKLIDEENCLVQIYGPNVILERGQLHPLPPLTEIHYNGDMSLNLSKVQQFQINDNLTAVVQFDGRTWAGYILRGYTMQKFSDIRLERLNDHPEIFKALKTIESHYINLDTDEDYVEQIDFIEKTIELFTNPNLERFEVAQNNLKTAKINALNMFPGDKQLTLLITNLEYQIMKYNEKFNQWNQREKLSPTRVEEVPIKPEMPQHQRLL